jgi:hypothetical protein
MDMIPIKINLNNYDYEAEFFDTDTTQDLSKMLPMELTLERYAEHEYFSRLPHKLTTQGVTTTSDAYEANIYYFDGWNAFTVVFGDAHIDPFKVVHIGKIKGDVSWMQTAGNTVRAKIEKCK